MRTLRCRTEIAALRTDLFALTQDYGARPHWDPIHGDVRVYDDGRVWYRSKDGMARTVRYVSHDPPERVAMRMLEGPFIFRRFSGAWVFKALGATRMEVPFNYSFEHCGLLAIGEGFVARRLERTMNTRLAGLKTYAESIGRGKLKADPRRRALYGSGTLPSGFSGNDSPISGMATV